MPSAGIAKGGTTPRTASYLSSASALLPSPGWHLASRLCSCWASLCPYCTRYASQSPRGRKYPRMQLRSRTAIWMWFFCRNNVLV